MPRLPVMLSAASFAAVQRPGRPIAPPPAHIANFPDRAADCGGFVATLRWHDYRYSPEEYRDWLLLWRPQWAASFDYCCEPEVADGVVRERQERTTAMAYHFWTTMRDAPWAWCPTIQGWDIPDYLRHARTLAPLVAEQRDYYGSRALSDAYWVGIGTLCRRADHEMVRSVVRAVSSVLPGVPLHLWGVKSTVLRGRVMLPGNVVSVDSAAWNGLFGRQIEEWRISGLTRRAYAVHVALPRFLAGMDRATTSPKQMELL